MRLTLKEFKHEYRLYKNDFDLEQLIIYNRTTYRHLEGRDKEDIEDGWTGYIVEDE